LAGGLAADRVGAGTACLIALVATELFAADRVCAGAACFIALVAACVFAALASGFFAVMRFLDR
jgi:hypothetical protein